MCRHWPSKKGNKEKEIEITAAPSRIITFFNNRTGSAREHKFKTRRHSYSIEHISKITCQDDINAPPNYAEFPGASNLLDKLELYSRRNG